MKNDLPVTAIVYHRNFVWYAESKGGFYYMGTVGSSDTELVFGRDENKRVEIRPTMKINLTLGLSHAKLLRIL